MSIEKNIITVTM